MLGRNFQEAMRVAVDDLKQTQNYEPFLELAVEDKALVLVTIDEWNNIHFHKVETELPKIETPVVTMEPHMEEPSNKPLSKQSKPRKVSSI